MLLEGKDKLWYGFSPPVNSVKLKKFILPFSLFLFLYSVYSFAEIGSENKSIVDVESILRTPDQKAERIAQSALGLGRLIDVEQELQALSEQSPTSGVTHYWLGVLYKEKGQYEKSIQHLKKSVASNPTLVLARIELAKVYALKGSFNVAEETLSFLLKIQPGNELALSSLAIIYFQQGKLDQAINKYTKLIRLNPNHPKAKEANSRLNILYLRKAETLAPNLNDDHVKSQILPTVKQWIRLGQLNTTKWLLIEFLKVYPDDGEANYLLGLVYSKRGQLKDAHRYLAKAVTKDQNNVSYLTTFGKVLARGGALRRALSTLQVAAQLSGNDIVSKGIEVEIGMVQGELLVRAGDLSGALKHYLTLLAIDSNNLELLNRVANVHISMGAKADAEKLFQRMLHIKRTDREEKVLLNQARAYLASGEYQNVIPRLRHILQNNPANSKAYYWLSVVYQRQNILHDAIDALQTSIAFAPDNIALRKELGKLLVKAGRPEEAVDVYEGLASNKKYVGQRKELLRLKKFVEGQYLIQKGEQDKALGHYQSMSLQFSNDIAVLEALASLYVRVELYEEAETTYLNALKLDRDRALTHLKLAAVYTHLKQDRNRRSHYKKAMQTDPFGQTGKNAKQNLLKIAQNYLDIGELDKAELEYKAVNDVYPNNIIAASNLALVMQGLRRFDDAEKYYQRVVQYDPSNFKMRMELARMYSRLGELDNSIKVFEEVYVLAPTSSEGREANANLDIMYNAKADVIIKNLDTDVERKKAVETARNWIQKKHRFDPSQRILAAVLEKDQQNEKAHYWLGSLFDRYHLFEKAIYHTAVSVSLAPHNPQLVAAFGRVLARAGNLDAAEAVYGNVIINARGTDLAGKTERLLSFIRAQRLVQSGNFVEALALYQNMYTGTAEDVGLMARIASVYLSMGDLTNAEKTFFQVLNSEPNSPSVHLQLARLYNRKGDKEASINALLKVVALDPNGALGKQALNGLGLSEGYARLKENNWQEAIQAFERVLGYDSKNIHAKLGIGSANLGAQDFAKAEVVLVEVVNIDPSNLEARIKLARVYVATRRIDAAVMELERVVAASRESKQGREALINLTNIYRQRGAALLKKGLGDEAVREYQKAIARNPDDWEAHYALGQIFQSASKSSSALNRGQLLKLAVQHYEETVRIKKDHYNSYINVGQIHEIFQIYDKARDAYVNALALFGKDNPQVEAALINTVRLQVVRQEFSKKNFDWVVNELEDMLKLEPRAARLYLFLATVHTRTTELEKAIDALKNVAKLSPRNISAKYRLGALYEQTNDLELAAGQYRLIVYSGQSNSIVGAARERLISVEERLRVITFRIRYNKAVSQSQVGDGPKSSSFSTSVRLDMVAHFRPRKNMQLSFNASPTYSSYHTSESDAIVPTYGMTGNINFRNGYLTANLSQSETQGLLQEVYQGEEKNASLTGVWRLNIPLLLSESEVLSPSTLQFKLAAREFDSADITYFNFRALTATGVFSQPFSTGGALTLSYNYSDTSNLVPLGADYAKFSHTATLSLSRPVIRQLSGYMSASVTYDKHKNYDTVRYSPSASIAKRRKTGLGSLTFGLNYQIHRKLSFSFDLSFIEQRTDMGRGFIYNSAGIPRGIQGGVLNDYRTLRTSAGLQFQF